jgi:hypothetical protein
MMIMSKTNDTSKLDRAKIENRVLAVSELEAVSGGWLPSGIPVAVSGGGGNASLYVGETINGRRIQK